MSLVFEHKKSIVAIVFAVCVILYVIYGLDIEKSTNLKRRFLGPRYRNSTQVTSDRLRKTKGYPIGNARFIGKELLEKLNKKVSVQKSNATKHRLLPNAIQIGVRKGGTRALLRALTLNPSITVCNKEVHFFDREENYNKGLQWYINKMPLVDDSTGRIIIEKTPAYFVTKKVPARVYNMSRTVKLLVVVRDPVKRAISDYTQLKSKSPKMRPFESYVYDSDKDTVIENEGFIRIGRYSQHLENWLNYFPLSQFHFVSGEQLVLDPVSELQDVEKFLNLKSVITKDDFYFNKTKGFPCFRKKSMTTVNQYTCLGKTKGRQHQPVSEKVLKKLREYYRSYNQRFYEMVGRDFGWS